MALTAALLAGCASADKQPATTKQTTATTSAMAGMNMAGSAVPTVNGVKPVAIHTLATAYWQGMEIQAQTMTPVSFVVFTGDGKQRLFKPTKNASFHLMVMLTDRHTHFQIPYASVWATITSSAGKVVYNDQQWPMISEYMGTHYGNNVPPSGARQLHAEAADQPAGLGPPPRVRARLADASTRSSSTSPGSRRHERPRRVHAPPLPDGCRRTRGGGGRRGGRDRSIRRRPRWAAGGPARPRARPAGAPVRLGRDADPRRVRQPDAAAASTGCCCSTCAALPTRATHGCSRRSCGGSSTPTRGAPPGCCSRPAGRRATSSGCCSSASPIPHATALSEFEQPTIDGYHLCLHLASDDDALLDGCVRARCAASWPRSCG